MKTRMALSLAAGLCACAIPAPSQSAGRGVTIEIRTDGGGALPLYPAASRGAESRVYAEAVQGQAYRIVVHNHLNRRVGLVIAVDGRNIISGQASWLRSNERMYILGPYESQSYEGWRASSDRVNRFYFTHAADSYASAFGDESAMGLISVATFGELRQRQPARGWFGWGRDSGSRSREADRSDAPSAKAMPGSGTGSAAPSEQRSERPTPRDLEEGQAGTGYGSDTYSPSYTVTFEPESAPLEKTFIKYEWREALVRLGVLRNPPAIPRNRLWDEGYAPPPPRRW
ncbi:MAG: hypothetical protein IPL96_09045 [Holophagaceae bacterium]|nr:hypothetical protein [Holophagaceae bacterium]